MISLGLWPGEAVIRLERVAINVADFEIPDNAGELVHGPLDPDGPTARPSTLPLVSIRDRLLAAGIPARLSGSAGTFLCNALMYYGLAAAERREAPPACGFIHVPYLPAQVAQVIAAEAAAQGLELHQRADLASMALDQQVAAVTMALACAAAHR